MPLRVSALNYKAAYNHPTYECSSEGCLKGSVVKNGRWFIGENFIGPFGCIAFIDSKQPVINLVVLDKNVNV